MGNCLKFVIRFARDKKAISGLETAIVLIAFVIVASAFAYAVLNMGFLATQKSEQVVLGGLASASSALVVDGPVYGYSSDTPGPNANMTSVVFWLKTASGANSVDLNPGKTTIAFENPRGVWPSIYFCSDGTGQQTGHCVGKDDNGNPVTPATTIMFTPEAGGTDYWVLCSATNIVWEVGSGMLLKANDKVRVTIDLTALTESAPPLSGGLMSKNEAFTITVKPPTGSVLSIQRATPAAIVSVDDLG